MNQFHFQFGDYFNDGHGQYHTVHVKTKTPYIRLQDIRRRIIEDYPCVLEMASEYDEPFFPNEIWSLLKDTNYPLERFVEAMDDIQYRKYETFKDVPVDEATVVTIDLVADVWIWLFNQYGAGLEVVNAEEMMNFNEGYGCF